MFSPRLQRLVRGRGTGICSARCRNRRSASCRIIREELTVRPPWRERGLIRHSSGGSKATATTGRDLVSGAAVEDPAIRLRCGAALLVEEEGDAAIPYWWRSDLGSARSKTVTEHRSGSAELQ